MEFFAQGFLSTESDDMGLKIANGLYKAAGETPLNIESGSMFANVNLKENAIMFNAGSGVYVDEDLLKKNIDSYKNKETEINDLFNKIKPYIATQIVSKNLTEKEKDACDSLTCWGGTWGGHSNPDYGLILNIGTNGLRDKVSLYKEKNKKHASFYESILITLDSIDLLAKRLSDMARSMSLIKKGEESLRLLRIADTLEIVPKSPAYDFFSACQAFWLTFCFDGIDSPGRFDQYMYPFYAMSDNKDRQECLEAIWQLFYETRTWNLCISGSDENFNDVSNPLTYAILDVAKKYKYNTPNLTMRIHRNTPQYLLKKAADVLATGIGMPVLYNDESVCPALEALDIPGHDAHLYCLNGCNQIDIMGKSHMGLEDGEVSLIKCLEFALFNGVCQITGKQVGLQTGDARDFISFDDLYNAYKKQVEYITDLCINMANKCQEIYAKYAVNPYRSALIEDCIEKGLDFKSGGPLYNHGQILSEGIADTADSLAVIKHFVYDKAIISMDDLINALINDFKGYEQLHKQIRKFTKFGNDNDYVDNIAKIIIDHFFQYLLTKRTFRGGIYGGGCSTFNRAPEYGRMVGAMPSGRLKGSPLLADSIGAVPGSDILGPTALINSVLKFDYSLAKSGFVFNIKFDKKLFASDEGKEGFLNLVKVYFENGGQQVSVNVISTDELRAAQKNPEMHNNLIVRIGGYSDYFNNLTKDLQDNIINRTEFTI